MVEKEESTRSLEEEMQLQKASVERAARLIHETRVYLETLSTDSAGSDPADFMSTDDATTCAEFIRKYGCYDHPKKEKLKLETGTHGEKLWGEGANNQQAPGIRRKRKLMDSGIRYKPIPLRTIWAGEGFFIERAGVMNILSGYSGGESVYLCTDGKLRCTRDYGVFPDSYGVGVGTLPRQLDLVAPEIAVEYEEPSEHAAAVAHFPVRLVEILARYALDIEEQLA